MYIYNYIYLERDRFCIILDCCVVHIFALDVPSELKSSAGGWDGSAQGSNHSPE